MEIRETALRGERSFQLMIICHYSQQCGKKRKGSPLFASEEHREDFPKHIVDTVIQRDQNQRIRLEYHLSTPLG